MFVIIPILFILVSKESSWTLKFTIKNWKRRKELFYHRIKLKSRSPNYSLQLNKFDCSYTMLILNSKGWSLWTTLSALVILFKVSVAMANALLYLTLQNNENKCNGVCDIIIKMGN